jgi:hypothetical protein
MREASFGRNVNQVKIPISEFLVLPIGQATARVTVYTKWARGTNTRPGSIVHFGVWWCQT